MQSVAHRAEIIIRHRDGAARVEDLEFRSNQSRVRQIAGRQVSGQIKIKHARGVHRLLIVIDVKIIERIKSRSGRGVKRVGEIHHTKERLAHFAKRGLVQKGRVTRLVVEQDSLEHRLQVAAHAKAVIVKRGGHAGHVTGGWVGGDEPLDELFADKRRGVGVPKQVVDRVVQIQQSGRSIVGRTRGARRERDAV